MNVMDKFRPSIMVMNHAAPDTMLDVFRANVQSALLMAANWANDDHIERLLIYLGTPLTPPCPRASSVNTIPFDRSLYAKQNEIARELIRKHKGLYLDLDAPFAAALPPGLLQDDGNGGQCIDPCRAGGVADAWVHLFYNALLDAFYSSEPDESELTLSAADLAAGEASEMISVAHLQADVPRNAPPLTRPIPGSARASTQDDEAQITRLLQCYSREGRWEYDATPRTLPWPKRPLRLKTPPCDAAFIASGGLAYEAAEAVAASGRAEEWKVREVLKYEWQAEQCPLERVSHEGFCRVLGPGKSILLVGDSLTLGLYRNLHSNFLFGVDVEKQPSENIMASWPHRDWDIGNFYEVCAGFSVCHEYFDQHPVTVRFCFNKVLSLTLVPLEMEAPWMSQLREWNPDILLLNRGAHYSDDDDFEEGVREALWAARIALPEALIVWRNTPPGHVNCTSYTAPLTERQPGSILPRDYHWADFARQNELVKDILAEVGAVYLDVDYSSALMPMGHFGVNRDGYEDCLHYCEPGPLDTWVKLFYNYLKALL
eukprot:TRINITY_DN358_c3_g1_i2.p1 TRINITY_DN358_c3_g1~~TRINITY_DN358_c3_g1_i2.p1  ORF type:complete len:544 (-),score=90.62 TRINITY_DN358_c3_g1_i2:1331-2962(-)